MPVHPKTKKNRPKKRLTNPRKNNHKTAIRIFLNRLFSNRKVINGKSNKSIQMGGFDPVGMVLGPIQKVSGKIADEMAKTITPEVIQDASGCISFMKTVGEKMPPPGGATILGISKILTMMIESIQFTMGVAKTASGITKDSVLLIIEPIYNKMQDKIGIDPASFRQLKLKIQSMDPNISKETLFKELQSLPQWNGLIESIKQNIESLPIPEMFKKDIRNIIGQFISSGAQSGQADISSSKREIKSEPLSSYTPEQINRAVSVINDIGMNSNDLSPQTMTAILASLLIPYEPESLDLTIKPNEPSGNSKEKPKNNPENKTTTPQSNRTSKNANTPDDSKPNNTVSLEQINLKIPNSSQIQSSVQSAISQSIGSKGTNALNKIQYAKKIAQNTQNQMLSAQEAMKSYQQNPKAILNNPLISSQIPKQLSNLPINPATLKLQINTPTIQSK